MSGAANVYSKHLNQRAFLTAQQLLHFYSSMTMVRSRLLERYNRSSANSSKIQRVGYGENTYKNQES